MLLNGNNLSGLLCAVNDDLFIKGLDGADVDNLCADAVCCQLFCCSESGVYADTGSYDGNVLTLANYGSLADLKLVIGSVVDHRNCCTAESDIYRALMLKSCTNCCLCLNIICRAHNYHSGNGAHESDVLVTLMGCSVLTNGYTCMGSTDLNIEVGITDGVSYLLKCTSCCKHCK